MYVQVNMINNVKMPSRFRQARDDSEKGPDY